MMMMSMSMPTSTSSSSSSTPATTTTTASGYLALLQEDDLTLRGYALEQLLQCIDTVWHQVAEALPDLEAMAEDSEDNRHLPRSLRQTAAAVASRVFFHLDEPTQALRLALEAGDAYFDPMAVASSSSSSSSPSPPSSSSPYVERLVAAALDAFCTARRNERDAGETTTTTTTTTSSDEMPWTTEQLKPMIYRLLDASCQAGRFPDAIGIALEACDAEKLRDILHHPLARTYPMNQPSSSLTFSGAASIRLLKYALEATITVVTSKAFRTQALQVIAECLQQHVQENDTVDKADAAYELVRVYQWLGQAQPVATVLSTLLQSTIPRDVLLAYQLCFDIMDSGDQAFVRAVSRSLFPSSAATEATTTTTTATEASTTTLTTTPPLTPLEQAKRVLLGGFSAELALSFLHKESRADRLIMETLKRSLDERSSGSRSSILHNAAVVTHSVLYAGTTNDSFLREYLDWMKRASNW